jgi:hypothetical protein
MELKPGMRAEWHKVQRGGYGFATNVPVVVVSTHQKRVGVLVPLKTGDAIVRFASANCLYPRDYDDAIDEQYARQFGPDWRVSLARDPHTGGTDGK